MTDDKVDHRGGSDCCQKQATVHIESPAAEAGLNAPANQAAVSAWSISFTKTHLGFFSSFGSKETGGSDSRLLGSKGRGTGGQGEQKGVGKLHGEW